MTHEIYKLKIGPFDCTIIKDLMFTYKVDDYFNNVKPEDLEDALRRYEITADVIESPYVVLLLERGEQKILIDSGIGFSEKAINFGGHEFFLKGRLKQLLIEQSIKATDITHVIISHFHPDHIGGIFSNDQLNFPNATFHVHEKEWNFWHSSLADSQPALFKLFVEKNITPLKGYDLNLIKEDFSTILDGITSVNALGHSAGQMALIIGEGSDQLLYAADSFLHPLHVENMDWTNGFDFDQHQAKETRAKLATLAYENKMLVQSFHFDFPGLGTIDKKDNNWFWHFLNV